MEALFADVVTTLRVLAPSLEPEYIDYVRDELENNTTTDSRDGIASVLLCCLSVDDAESSRKIHAAVDSWVYAAAQIRADVAAAAAASTAAAHEAAARALDEASRTADSDETLLKLTLALVRQQDETEAAATEAAALAAARPRGAAAPAPTGAAPASALAGGVRVDDSSAAALHRRAMLDSFVEDSLGDAIGGTAAAARAAAGRRGLGRRALRRREHAGRVGDSGDDESVDGGGGDVGAAPPPAAVAPLVRGGRVVEFDALAQFGRVDNKGLQRDVDVARRAAVAMKGVRDAALVREEKEAARIAADLERNANMLVRARAAAKLRDATASAPAVSTRGRNAAP
jgi:hypothetical protein